MKKALSPYLKLVIASPLFFLSSCLYHPDPEPVYYPTAAAGWVPVYNTDQSATIIKSTDPVPIDNGGKIYVKGNLLYQLEAGKGIHVIDISQPANPQKLKFITVLGAQEIAIKNNMLYTNNLNDLVVIDISNLADVKESDRLYSMFHLIDQNEPPGSGYYECPDPAKGQVIAWKEQTIDSPKCRK